MSVNAQKILSCQRQAHAMKLSLAALVLAGGLSLAGQNAAAEAKLPAAVQPVQVTTVELATETATWSYVGTIRPRYQTDVGFRVGGKIVQRLVDVGQQVERGEPIARLDETDLRLALSSQEAELAAARIASVEATKAEARYRVLNGEGHVAAAALDQKVSAAAEARSRVERAERNVDLARNQLQYATLAAEHAGVIVALPVETGQVVTAGQMIARVSRLDAVEVEVALPEQLVPAVQKARAEIEIWGDQRQRIPAVLREVSPEADGASRSYRARFAFKSAGSVSFGRTAMVHLSSTDSAAGVQLPLSAVMNDGRGALVWVLSGDQKHVIRTPVEVISYGRDNVLIGRGLKSGDRVVTLGVHMLDPEKPVRVIEQRTVLR
ncbi:MAG: efflux RND transporter periplasmic adaptor subunit [Proteobacteria bacterium]|nr:efflux RND transporter periplasmic adaptor subunit [Pseudomonadota bacterium]